MIFGGIAAFILGAASPAIAEHHESLDAIIEARSDEARARDQYRHPAETLKLFGIREGMTVMDALPGSWYGDIIAPLLGPEGRYIGLAYGDWYYKGRFGDDYEGRWEDAQSFLTEWPEKAAAYGGGEDIAAPEAYFFPGLPDSLNGSVDAALFFRALHHTNRFDPKNLDMTAADVFRVLKPGGIVGVVQHRAPESADDDWANGNNGYLKQSRVISAFKNAGFELENASEINANPKDQPGPEDAVWRLPPSSDEPAAVAIGESDRMTLVFRKPS
jgi:predicted methyltransferase